MPKQGQSISTSSSLALLSKIGFCRNWVPMHHVATSLMCLLAPEVVCYTSLQNWSTEPLLFPDCSSLCSWSALRLSCGTLAYVEHQIWENNGANHCWMLYLVLFPEGDLSALSATLRSNLSLFCLSVITNVHDSVLGLLLWTAVCGLTPSRWSLQVCQQEARIMKHSSFHI